MTNRPLLQLRGLTVDFPSAAKVRLPWRPARAAAGVRAVDQLSLEIRQGETVGLVGASGSGKTTTALAVLGLLPRGARRSGAVLWRGRDLTAASATELRNLRGAEIGFIPQDPMAALHPVKRVDRQVAEAVLAHAPELGRAGALEKARDLLARTGLPPDRIGHARYPFEWSGGMRQRALIAMAIAHDPQLLIADEPTTALDATTRAEILTLLRQVRDDVGMAMLLITHDPDTVAEMADRVVAMRHGAVVRSPPAQPPAPTPIAAREPESDPRPVPVLRVAGVSVRYPVRGDRGRWFTAVESVGLELHAAETLCLVGESGAGKSTLARAILRLEPVHTGRVILDGFDLTTARGRALRLARRDIQVVFQDPNSSLNPRRRVGASIAEPLRIHGLARGTEAERRVASLLEAVGLAASFGRRFPFQLSGGERQRVAIARALALKPRVLVLDEPVTALDADTRAAIVRLLADLQSSRGIAYLLIAHDLRFVRAIAHRVAVMRGGRILEMGPTDAIFRTPRDPYTRSLVAAVQLP